MSLYAQTLLCLGAFSLTAALYTPSPKKTLFETPQEFFQFKEDRKLMWCRMEPQLTDEDEWIRDIPTCSFGGYYPVGPTTEL